MASLGEKNLLSRRSPWLRFIQRLMPVPVSYRPERHYMRGPGPKYREKHARLYSNHPARKSG